MKWILVAVAAYFVYSHHQKQVSVEPLSTPATPLQPGGAVYLAGGIVGATVHPLNTGPTGPYGTIGPHVMLVRPTRPQL